jgi:hypothetical protein
MGHVTKPTSKHTYQVHIPRTNQQRLIHESQVRLFHRRPDEELSTSTDNSVASFLFPSHPAPAAVAIPVPVQHNILVPENQNLHREGEGPVNAVPENADNNQVPDNNQIEEPDHVADNPVEDSSQQSERGPESRLATRVNENFESNLAVAMAKAKQKRNQLKTNQPVEEPVERPVCKSERVAARTAKFTLPKHRED